MEDQKGENKLDIDIEYRLMCQKAKEIQVAWKPEVGDFMVSMASYCGDNKKCGNGNSCPNCLEMSNKFVISGTTYFVDEIGGRHWFFGGSPCNNNGGHKMNDTFCFAMTESGYSEVTNKFYTSQKSDFLWLPRQDQLQDMFWNGLSKVHKVRKFVEWLNTATYNASYDSMEVLWLMLYMEEIHNKKWNKISNIKEWETII